jgi:hypothetical protein
VTREQLEQACLLAEISDSQLKDTLNLGNWSTDSIPWIPFFSFLIASAAGSLKATVLKIIRIVENDGLVSIPVVQDAYEFLTMQDKSVKTSTDKKLKEWFNSIKE